MVKPVPIGAYHPIPTYEDLLTEIARLRDELSSATRHMEMAEAAWLRETAGNSPVAIVLTDEERKAVEWARCIAKMHSLDNSADTLRKLLERMGGGR